MTFKWQSCDGNWHLLSTSQSSLVAGQRDNSCDESHVSQGCSRGSSTDLSILKNFEIACLDVCERSWLDKMRTVELNPWTMGKSTNPKRDVDVNAVQQRRRLHDRSNQKHRQESYSERKPPNPWTANLSPSASRQSTARDNKSRSDETKPGVANKKRVINLLQMWRKESSFLALPIT